MSDRIPEIGSLVWHSISTTLFVLGGRSKSTRGIKLWLNSEREGEHFPLEECSPADPKRIRELSDFTYREGDFTAKAVRKRDRIVVRKGDRQRAIQLPEREADELNEASQSLAQFFGGVVVDLEREWTEPNRVRRK